MIIYIFLLILIIIQSLIICFIHKSSLNKESLNIEKFDNKNDLLSNLTINHDIIKK